jgi:YegS/Rv2252/BmrU family lipid kinase
MSEISEVSPQQARAGCENSSSMRRAVLLYNPQSGSRHARRKAIIDRTLAALRGRGVEVASEPTTGPRDAGGQARRLVSEGFDTVIACGGDGTVHDVLQGMVGTEANLGVIPLGTANSLAQDLGLSGNPTKAAEQLVEASVRRIAVGQIDFQRATMQRESRYFTVATGVGVDAALFYRLNAKFKQRWGMAAYVAASLRMWAFEKFHPFVVEWFDTDLNTQRSEIVTQLLVVRISNFGGVLNRLAPGADLLRNDFRLVIFKTSNKARYLRFATGRLVNRDWQDKQIELVHASNLRCLPHRSDVDRASTVYAEADGELLGRLPVAIRIVPDALNLLIPKTASTVQNGLTIQELPRE